MSTDIRPPYSMIPTHKDLSHMDLETLLLAVQTGRVEALERQMKTQIGDIQNRNIKMGKLQDALVAINAIREFFKSDDGGEKTFGDIPIGGQKGNSAIHNKLCAAATKALIAAGYSNRNINTNTMKKDFEVLNLELKNSIDKENSSQQMDTLRLQSMSGKHNEAIELMSTFSKKMQDSRSSIISNMR